MTELLFPEGSRDSEHKEHLPMGTLNSLSFPALSLFLYLSLPSFMLTCPSFQSHTKHFSPLSPSLPHTLLHCSPSFRLCFLHCLLSLEDTAQYSLSSRHYSKPSIQIISLTSYSNLFQGCLPVREVLDRQVHYPVK